jgi:2-iminoacetate synthase ThiH
MNLNIIGSAVFNIYDEDTEKNSEIEVSFADLEIVTEVHDAGRQMGAEHVHIVTGTVNDIEFVWHVYEYPEGVINSVVSPTHPELISDFKFGFDT